MAGVRLINGKGYSSEFLKTVFVTFVTFVHLFLTF